MAAKQRKRPGCLAEEFILAAWDDREPVKPIVANARKPDKPSHQPAKLDLGTWGTSGVPRTRNRIADDKTAIEHVRARLAQGATPRELEMEMTGGKSSTVRALCKRIKEGRHQ
jgi:hypothetical protein